MPDQQQFTTKIIVSGALDPSLQKAFGYTNEQMMKMNNLINGLGNNSKIAVKSIAQFSPALQKATVEANRLTSTMAKVGTVIAGLGIADVLVSGLKSAVGLAEQLGDKFERFAAEASKLASQRELMTNSIANLMGGNQPLAKAIMNQEWQTAVLSPFQGKNLQAGVRELLGAQVPLGKAQWLANRGGDIVAALGGSGEDELPRLFNAMAQTEASGFFSGEQAKELRHLGIPYQKILENLLHVDAAQLDKMQRKHLITANVFEQMIEKLTGKGGIFFKGMIHFAETFQGLETSIMDLTQKFEADFGDIANAWAKLVFKCIGGSDGWNQLFTWTENLGKANQAVIQFVTSLPTSQVFSGVMPFFQTLNKDIHYLLGPQGLGYFFDYNKGGTQGSFYEQSGYHLNVAGMDKVKEYLNDVNAIFNAVNITLRTLVTAADIAVHLSGVIPGLQILGAAVSAAADLVSKSGGILNTLGKGFQQGNKAIGNTFQNFTHGRNLFGPNDYWPSGVPYFASGGIVNSPTLGVIGESGPEAILPLSGASTLDDLATAISNLNSFLMYAFPSGTPGGAGGSAGSAGRGSIWYPGQGFGYSAGGVKMTQYGPAVDPPDSRYYDWNSYHGIGDRNNHLVGGISAALTQSEREALFGIRGISTGRWFKTPRGKWLRDDDTAPESDRRIDEYMDSSNGSAHYHITIHAIDAASFEKIINDHVKVIHKAIDKHQATRLNSKALV